MKKWSKEVEKLLEGISKIKVVNFEIFDKQNKKTIFSSAKDKRATLPGVNLISVKFTV